MSQYIAIAAIRIEHNYYNPPENSFVGLEPTPETKKLMRQRGVMLRQSRGNEWQWIMADDASGFADKDVLELSMIVKDPCFLQHMQEDIKLIDLVIELVDARVPMSSRNPDIDELGKNKARLILLNKADLADEAETRKWAQMFEDMGIHVVKIDARNKGTLKQVQAAQQEACKEIGRAHV